MNVFVYTQLCAWSSDTIVSDTIWNSRFTKSKLYDKTDLNSKGCTPIKQRMVDKTITGEEKAR